jgi:hypothetical protein
MLHPSLHKPRFSRTKLFPSAYTRNKSVTPNFFCASAQSLTQTSSVARKHDWRITTNSAMRVAMLLQDCNTSHNQKRGCAERNSQSATRRGCSIATRTFYVCSGARISGGVNETQKVSTHVRVLSEYSDIPNETNLDFPEQNTRFPVDERNSTLTSFFYSHGARLKSVVSRLSPNRVGFVLGNSSRANSTTYEFQAENPTIAFRTCGFTPTRNFNFHTPTTRSVGQISPENPLCSPLLERAVNAYTEVTGPVPFPPKDSRHFEVL